MTGFTNFPGGFRHTNEFTANAGITAQQHLLRDAWIDRDRMLILTRRKDFKISQEAMRFLVMQTVLAVELAYDDVIAALELVRVQEKSLQSITATLPLPSHSTPIIAKLSVGWHC